MLNMAAYALAGPIANPEKAAVTATENIKGASPTPIDIKLDLGTLGDRGGADRDRAQQRMRRAREHAEWEARDRLRHRSDPRG